MTMRRGLRQNDGPLGGGWVRRRRSRCGPEEGAYALAGGGKDGVDDGGQDGREGRFAEAGGAVLREMPEDLDLRGLAQAEERVLGVVGLLDAAGGEGDLLLHLAHALQNGAFDLSGGAGGVHDLAAYVTGGPDVVDGDAAGGVDGDFGDLCEVAGVAVVGGDAEAVAGSGLARGPVGLFGDKLEDSLEAARR